jgi:hypothetical protein
MAIGAPVQLGSAAAAAGSMTQALSTTAESPAGNTIVVLAGDTTGTAVMSVTDSAGNTYVAGLSYSDGANFRQRPFWCLNALDLPSGGTITVAFQTTGGVKLVAAVSVSGLAAADTQAAGATGTSTAPSIASGALGWPNEIVFGMLSVHSGAADTFTEGSGFTSNSPALMTGALRWAYQIVTSNAGVTYAPTLGTSRTWGANTLTFSGAVASPFDRAAQFTYLEM